MMAVTSIANQPKTYLSKCFDTIFSLSDVPPLIFQVAYLFTAISIMAKRNIPLVSEVSL